MGFAGSANTAAFQIASTATKPATDSHWHSLEMHYDGANNGTVYVDGAGTSTGVFNTSIYNPSYYCVGGHSGNGNLTGDVAEIVFTYDGLFTGSPANPAADILASDTGYWGSLPQ